MDLIDVLWRQDIDLGVGREMFDVTLRKELEKERELELLKQREEELLKTEKLPEDDPFPLSDVSYMVDSETGELTVAPAGVSEDLLTEPPAATDTQELSVAEAMRLLEEAAPASTAPVVPQPPVSSDNTTLNSQLDDLLQTDTISQGLTELNRQSSYELHWQDVSSLLDLDTNTSTDNFTADPPNMANSTAGLPYPPYALVHNTTLAPVNFTPAEVYPSGGFPPQEPYTLPTYTPTNTSDLYQSDLFNMRDTGNLLHMLEDCDELTDLPQFDHYMAAHSSGTSSDSAISMSDSLSMEHDMSDMSSCVSPFEAMEGATGGTEDKSPAPTDQVFKYEDDDYHMTDYHTATTTMQMNHTYNNSVPSVKPASPQRIAHQAAHNHTYTLPPEQASHPPTPPKDKPPNDDFLPMRARDLKKLKAAKLPFSMEQITSTPVEEFNELLQRHTLSDAQARLVKDIRRRGKNKIAAQNCRKRKLGVIQTLEDEVGSMKAERDELVRERKAMQREMGLMKGRYSKLYDEVFRSLRDDSGKPYDPSMYALQQTADGNVFLVPQQDLDKVDQDHKQKSSRKRKSHKNA